MGLFYVKKSILASTRDIFFPHEYEVSKMKQGITFFILFAAVAAYLAGSTVESMIFLMVGAVLESIFWFRLLWRNETTSKLKD
jgi:hypothetical protein